MNVLVVGGAGYIGSHCVRQLQAAGHRPVVLDNLIFGHRQAVHAAVPFYECDLGDRQAVGQILRDELADRFEVLVRDAVASDAASSSIDTLLAIQFITG